MSRVVCKCRNWCCVSCSSTSSQHQSPSISVAPELVPCIAALPPQRWVWSLSSRPSTAAGVADEDFPDAIEPITSWQAGRRLDGWHGT